MITEDYCSFEISKLLKEKGFDGDSGDCKCHMFYCEYTEERIMPICEIGFIQDNETVFFAPTHQMAMKWFREKYYIYADPIKQGNYNDCSEYYTWIVARMGIIHRNSSVVDKLSYEDAVEAALKYALENLI